MPVPLASTPATALRWLAPLLCTLAGLAWGTYLVGPATLDPTSVEWMLQDDWAPALFGWLYARQSPWGLPLGAAEGYLHPVGTSLAYADAAPWWGTLFKLLAPLLPEAFQIHGLWLALCFGLQGFFGALIVAQLSARPLHQLLGGLLFVLSPVLAMRLGHLSLCGHWLVLALLWVHLRSCRDARAAARTLGLAALFVGLAAGIHVYLAAMTLALALALVFRLQRTEGLLARRQAWTWAASLLGVSLGVLGLFGYFSTTTTAPAPGFSHYSANVLSLVDPAGFSRYLPALPVGAGQYEGSAYLGVGVIALGVSALGVHWRRKEGGSLLPSHLRPLLAVCLLMGLFALSSRVQLAGWTLVSYQRLFNAVLGPLGQAFRSPGRFIWPLHYLVMVGAIALLLRVLRQRPAWASGVLGLAVALQASELSAEECCRSRFTPRVQALPGGTETWSLAAREYQHVVLFPPFRVDGAGRGCAQGTFTVTEALPFAWQAYQLGMTFNSGYVSRLDAPRIQASCARLEEDIQRGRLDAEALYVVHAGAASRFLTHTAGRAACGSLDGTLVCVSVQRQGAFREALARHPVPPMPGGGERGGQQPRLPRLP